MLSVANYPFKLSVFMLNVVMVTVVTLNVVVLNIVAPLMKWTIVCEIIIQVLAQLGVRLKRSFTSKDNVIKLLRP